MKKKAQLKGPRNIHNIEIYNKLTELKERADETKNKHASFSYYKVLKSLEKYPLPILTMK